MVMVDRATHFTFLYPLWEILGFFHDVINSSPHFLARLLPLCTSYPISCLPAKTHPHTCAKVAKHTAILSFFIQILKRQHLRCFSSFIIMIILDYCSSLLWHLDHLSMVSVFILFTPCFPHHRAEISRVILPF